jgi:DNA-binding response OmpR family regulator
MSFLKQSPQRLKRRAANCYTFDMAQDETTRNNAQARAHADADHVTNRPTVMLVDDDDELAELLTEYFAREGYVLTRVACISDAIPAWRANHADLLILDLMLPDGSGLDLCREMRVLDATVPIIILTARGDPVDRVVGLEIGADDYIAKPFDARELIARVRALLRRHKAMINTAMNNKAMNNKAMSIKTASGPQEQQLAARREIEVGEIVIDLVAARIRVRGRHLPLTAIEFRLLAALALADGGALDRDALAAASQPGNYRPLERAVDVQIARLRKKLREATGAETIVTVRGQGYAMVVP